MQIIGYGLLACVILGVLAYGLYYGWATTPVPGESRGPRFFGHRYPIEQSDLIPIAVILVLWLVIAYVGLGDNEAPQTFHEFGDEYVEIDLGGEYTIGRVFYYTGLGVGEYSLQFSADSVNWTTQTAMEQTHANLFKWLEAELNEEQTPTRFIRISALEGTISLGELAIYTDYGEQLNAGGFAVTWSGPVEDGGVLFDEQSVVPERASYLNSAYFDEIYHARTAYEHVHQIQPYEVSHPPLGKIIISLGIRMFGMTPFGWRFMGALFGSVMLACLYVLIKSMFGKRIVAVCGTLVFAFDFMHYVQTRIATIDTYAVFFIILMYFFLYRYISLDYETPFKKTLLPLFLCGLCFGLGAASKWTCLYAGMGLAVLYVIYQVLRGRYWVKSGRQQEFIQYLIKTIGVSFVFFIIVPGVVYYLSYIPVAQGRDIALFGGEYMDMVIDNQRYMLNYHSGVDSEHPYASRWYQWVFNVRPILYYRDYLDDGLKSAFSAFGNPTVYWGGLIALITLPMTIIRRRDGRAAVILVGYLALLAPWLVITRPTFAYHYFTNTIFLVLAIAFTFNDLMERKRGPYKQVIYAFTAVTIGLFVLFYPSLSGVAVPTWYTDNILKWLPSWPL